MRDSVSELVIDGKVVKMPTKKEFTSVADNKVPSSFNTLKSLGVILPASLFTDECHLCGSVVSKGLILAFIYYLFARLFSLTKWFRNLAETAESPLL
jgi:hypothetical protein